MIYLPFLQTFFNTSALSLADLGISLGAGALVFASIELEKWWVQRRVQQRRPAPAVDNLPSSAR